MILDPVCDTVCDRVFVCAFQADLGSILHIQVKLGSLNKSQVIELSYRVDKLVKSITGQVSGWLTNLRVLYLRSIHL